MYTITLADGTVLSNLELNGNNFIANGIVEDIVFKNNLDTVIISDDENTETYTDMQLLSNIVREGRSWIVLGEKTEQQKREEQVIRQIDEMHKIMLSLFSENKG